MPPLSGTPDVITPRRFRPAGERHWARLDCRIVAATGCLGIRQLVT
jgi:hypothetical protein